MGKLFYIMGKSSTGKDTIYENVISRKELQLRPYVMYTTRPIRPNEVDGESYYFVNEERLHEMQEKGQVIELRSYDTVHGIWYYFTADSEATDLARYNYLALGTLESYQKVRDFYGADRVIPIYIEADDELRLMRYIKREKKQEKPNYEEVCRRFLADQKDFSEDKISALNIDRRFQNNGEREVCMDEVAAYISSLCLAKE